MTTKQLEFTVNQVILRLPHNPSLTVVKSLMLEEFGRLVYNPPCQCEIYEVCPQCDPDKHAEIVTERIAVARKLSLDKARIND
jgi:hypothetical protein